MDKTKNNLENIYIIGVKESIWIIAYRDLILGVNNYRLWMFLGWQDIKQRYRRSLLGPLWITLSTGIMILMMSVLYGRLFKMPLEIYSPFLASGTIIWAYISSICNDACETYMSSSSLIKQVRMPLSLHVLRMVWRNIIIYLHNIIILVPVWLIFDRNLTLIGLIGSVLGFFMVSLNGVWIGIVLGAFCTRYRDVSQIVMNLVQVVFFVTPIMWLPSILEGRGVAWWFIMVNPFYHLIEIIRAPLLDNVIPYVSWQITGGITGVGMLLGIFTLGKFKNRVAYWL